ncbi:nitroreductase family protein [Enemella evansiae]|nr:nitroreductase family protein [Enemella evansiae]
MNLDTAIRRRRMVREYADAPVPRALVEELLDLGVRAPSAGFSQGVSLQTLDGAAVDRFWELTVDAGSRWLQRMRTARVLILVWTSKAAYLDRYAEPDKGWTDRDETRWTAPYWYVDAGMAAENILLGVVDRGLGACFFGIPPGKVDAVRDGFGVPAEQLSVGVISLGWPRPGETRSGSPRRRQRVPREQQVHWGQWGEPG